ncbi:MAG: hypothetical protein IJC02_12440 [Lachnospiraceae bacterium]|nr:hypothetical protein [Lachnospiraceae bacterium]MBQ6688898.1 hypothetical protein [Bacteroidales bacterium]
MNFLWDIALKAQQQGKREEELLFCQAREYSPFYEQAFSYLNETKVEEAVIELNLLVRFAEIFQYILAEDNRQYPEFEKYLIDAALHMILHADIYHGVSKRDIYIRKLTQEIENGTYWKRAAEEFKLIPFEKRSRIATLVLNQIQTGASVMTFRRALLVMFPNAVLYQIKAERKKLLLYLKMDKNKTDERMLQLIEDMFLPVSYHLRVFWKYHFGIIGVDDTMKIDEIAIY